jgi:hypothetical protein
MNIQDCIVEKGFVFELELAAKGWNCSVKNKGEFIDNVYGFKLETRANPPVEEETDSVAEGLILTLKGFRTEVPGKLLETEDGNVTHFSRSFLVDPKESVNTSLLLTVIEEA